jgi:hypothetical protein
MRTIRLAFFGFAVLVSAPVLAQSRDPATAEALFRAGRAAAERGDYPTACPKFEESKRLDPTLGTAFNLADCDEHIGKLASAWQLFREVAQRLPAGDERIAIATSRASAIEPRLPKLALKAAGALPPGTVVLRDGVEMGSASFEIALPVDPGEHTIVVKAPNHVDRQFTATATTGKTSEVVLDVGPAAPAPPPSTATVSTSVDTGAGSSGVRRSIGFGFIALGSAALVTTAVSGAIAISAKNTVEEGCDAAKRCTPDALDAGDRGRTAATISTVAFGVGLASTVAGLYLVLSSDSKTVGNTAPSIGVAVVPGAAFVGVQGRMW